MRRAVAMEPAAAFKTCGTSLFLNPVCVLRDPNYDAVREKVPAVRSSFALNRSTRRARDLATLGARFYVP